VQGVQCTRAQRCGGPKHEGWQNSQNIAVAYKQNFGTGKKTKHILFSKKLNFS